MPSADDASRMAETVQPGAGESDREGEVEADSPCRDPWQGPDRFAEPRCTDAAFPRCASVTQSAPPPLNFSGIMVLAPMVRIGTLPLRLLALEYGADLVWTEEMVAKKVAPCERVENMRLQTIEFYDKAAPWTRVWQTCSAERGKVVFQIGASEPEAAVAAIRVVIDDIAAVCLNMGCPKEFSVKNGMGAALLKKPNDAAAIVRELKANFAALPILAKIRLLDTTEETAALMRCLEQAGCSAISVHVRHVNQRSSTPAHRVQLAALVAAVKIPVLGNGDVVDYTDAQQWREESGCAGVMVARMAAENPSCFRKEGRLPQADVLRQHVDKCLQFEEVYQNMKYYYNHFFSEVCVPGSALFEDLTRTKSRREIAALLGRQSYFHQLDTERGRGGGLEAQGWWKGNKVHPEHQDYTEWIKSDANGRIGGAEHASQLGEKRVRAGSQEAEGEAIAAGRGPQGRTFSCAVCGEGFASRNAMFRHMRSARHLNPP